MSVQVQVSEVINRPVADVFHFFAREHVRNHPRWDPAMELEQLTDGPIDVGTVIRRRHTRSGTLTEGTMQVVEFIPDRVMGTIIHDGPLEIRGRVNFDPLNEDQTRMTMNVELPGMDESTDTSMLKSGMERSVQNIKQMIEAET